MSRLGVDVNTGLIYEGLGHPTHPVWPTPPICNATLIETSGDIQKIPHNFFSNAFGWIFIETSFDFSARIRRGRLYQNFGQVSREWVSVEAHPDIHSDLIKAANNAWRVPKELSVYIECTDLLNKQNGGIGSQLVLGQVGATSSWKILQVERSIGADIVVTLRSDSSLGVLPELDTSKIAPANLENIRSAYERALNAAYRELPTSVVDQCRNAATVFISRWMQHHTGGASPIEQDLGAWIKTIKSHFGEHERLALRSALEIINRLHPRGKDSERNKHTLRSVDENDAAFSVHALGFILREIDWAQ